MGKRSIARRLNCKDHDGYFYWQITAEKLGLLNECRAWEAADNPTEKMLTAYGDKEGRHHQKLDRGSQGVRVDSVGK
ncbi:hypothetical protein OS493_013380 [Desmophyllum pertusum]|uniref:Uncharacterized protein n=1 Tax=Desmophyllum pertusum TaxID=174260 RepID=A0A9W9YDJ0_9CNID|nr:hypothetical protein OS493_013380 [Desmophyllum pertusum]